MKALAILVLLGTGAAVAPEPETPTVREAVEVLCAGGPFTNRYDGLIRAAVVKHWPVEAADELPCAWKAQLAQESSLNPATCNSANSAGAKCLAQILPQTAERIEKATGLHSTRADAKAAIYGGAWLMNDEWNGWKEPRGTTCRLQLAQIGYHGGRGHLYRAQKRARNAGHLALCWPAMAPYMTVSQRNVELHWKYIEGIEH